MGIKWSWTDEQKERHSMAMSKSLGTLLFHKTQNRWYIKTEKGWMRRNRFLMEQKIGKTLDPCDIVHHVNGDITDDKIENLLLIKWGKHTSHHWNGKKHSEEAKQKIKRNHWSKKGYKMLRENNGKFLRRETCASF